MFICKKNIAIVTLILLILPLNTVFSNSRIKPKKIYEDETSQIIFSFNGNISNVDTIFSPKIAGLEILGPQESKEQRYQNINGKITEEIITTYSYVIQANKPGVYNIAPIKIKVNGQAFTGKKHILTVIKGSRPGNTGGLFSFFGKRFKRKNGKAKATMRLNKKEAYVGEVIAAYYDVATKTFKRPAASILAQKQPEFKNIFSKMVMMQPSYFKSYSKQIKITAVPGFMSRPSSSPAFVLIPLKSGILGINKHLLNISDSNGLTYDKVINIKAVNFKVKELPFKNKPIDFSGNIGNFKMRLILDDSTINQYQEFKLRVITEGTGNFYIFNEPMLELNTKYFQLMDKKQEAKEVNDNPFEPAGTITYAYQILAKKGGTVSPGSVRLNWYNVKKNLYQEQILEIKKNGYKSPAGPYNLFEY